MSLLLRRRSLLVMPQGFGDVIYSGRVLFNFQEKPLDESGIPYVASASGFIENGHYCMFHSRNADYPTWHPNNPDDSFSFVVSDNKSNEIVTGLIDLGAYKRYKKDLTLKVRYLADELSNVINLPFRACYSAASQSVPDTYFDSQTITAAGQGIYSVNISSMPMDGAFLMLQVYTLRANTNQRGTLSIEKIWFE